MKSLGTSLLLMLLKSPKASCYSRTFDRDSVLLSCGNYSAGIISNHKRNEKHITRNE